MIHLRRKKRIGLPLLRAAKSCMSGLFQQCQKEVIAFSQSIPIEGWISPRSLVYGSSKTEEERG